MDGIEDILYVVFMVAFLLFRLFRKKPEEQKMPTNPQPHPAAPASPSGTPPKSLMDVIREEMERQKKLSETKPEIKQKTQKFKKTEKKSKKTAPAEFLPPQYGRVEDTEPIDHIEKEEGVSAITGKIKHVITEVPEQENHFEFDPREAFRMKILLERPYA